MLIFDAHLDLSLNALEYNRDLRKPLAEIRGRETGLSDLAGRGRGTVCFPEMRAGGVGACVATLIGGCMQPPGPVASWNSPEQAWANVQGQLAWYTAMEQLGELRQIRTGVELESHFSDDLDAEHGPIAYVLSLEGADSLRTLDDLEPAHAAGLRALGPAHYGRGRYALGHDQAGPLPRQGKDLLREMDRLGMILDVTHLCDQSFWDALELYQGPVWASHHNCRALVNDPRQISDEQILAVAERGSVIGVALDAWMIVPGWIRGKSTPGQAGVTLERVADHVDHICQLTGTAEHVGIGTDLDGGFGTEQCPLDVDSIADIARLSAILEARGYSERDVRGICHQNFIDFIRVSL